MNHGKEFRKYAVNHLGLPGTTVDAVNNYMVTASMTPYILEEREMRVTQMDVFSRLMMNRIIWVAGPVNDQMSTVVQAQLMFLDNLDESDITMHVDSPGGSVKSGLSMVDVMNYVSSDISTINTGMAASMGSILLGAGTVGKRYSLPNSKVMIHQVSSGNEGTIIDMEISLAEAKKYNDILFKMLGDFTKKDPKKVKKDAERDLWFTSEEAKAYGLIDEIIINKKKK